MNFLKHILVAVALLATMLPCCHAAEHHGHGHDAAMELCAFAADLCECHSCERRPCSDDIEIQLERTTFSKPIEHPGIPAILLPIPARSPDAKKTNPPVSGILAVIQTVQLLI